MLATSLVALLLFGVVCVGLRTWIHVRQTGESPFRAGPVGHGALAVAGFTAPFAVALVLDATDSLDRLSTAAWLGPAGVTLSAAGIAATMWAQLAMGASWRIGIDDTERTDLVTTGPYRRVRNPIYTAMFAFALGQVLLVPNMVNVVGFVLVVAVIELVVRRVEEPHLLQIHGQASRTWMAGTGRFVPGIGALR